MDNQTINQTSHDFIRPFFSFLLRTITFLPWLWLLLILLLTLGAAIQAGQLPSYGWPDPKDLPFLSLLHGPIMLLLAPTLLAPIFWFIAGLVNRILNLARPYSRFEIIIFFSGWLVAAWLIIADLADLITWLVD